MGQGDGVEEEEGVLAVLLEPADHVSLDDFLGVGLADVAAVVAGEGDGLLIGVEVGGEVGVSVTLAVVAEEVVYALFLRCALGVEEAHAPLAEGRSVVAGVLSDFTDRDDFIIDGILTLGEPLEVAAYRAVTGMQAGVEDGTTGSADAGTGVGLLEERAFVGQAIEGWSLDQLLAINTHVALGNVIGEDEDKVGRAGLAILRFICA